ncbi:MFS transporter [Janthinobacterium psychrotolerans]|uniref:Nitrate/nitrite transporter NarK n=1 Tax=Janthinobacterium psychrotolerans TaxID=1747903 RepID=A0A1A7BSS8_9BURK|nr:MFS transporter [Janthinobacterium psychrotolerans]OBV36572.1 Nitrate/nitrite transporter NarK [Janthinobacterium psychrotolerans]
MYNAITGAGAAPPATAADADNALYRKVTGHIIPFLFVCYVISFLDRINIGFAQLQMKQDLGFSDAMYGLGAAVFYVGYVLFEVPSNLLLAKYGARKTFVRIMLLWGAASVSMAWVSTPMQFYLLRFTLGVFEAGFFPGIVLYLTYWYPPLRRASVLSFFFAGVAVACVIGGLVSGWIMRDMAGVLGLKGWQWMFALEGAPALALAVIAFFYLDDGPRDAKWLGQHEKARLADNLADDAPPAGSGAARGAAWFSNPRVYLYAFIYFALTCGSLTLSFWMPLMIRDFGVQDVLMVSLYSVIPNAIGAVGVILIARLADRRAQHGKFFAACTVGGALALAALTTHPSSLALALLLLSVATTLIFSALPIFWAMPTALLPREGRAGGIAMISSCGITSGIVAPWAIGQIKTATGSMDIALYILAVLLVVSAAVLLASLARPTPGAGRTRP